MQSKQINPLGQATFFLEHLNAHDRQRVVSRYVNFSLNYLCSLTTMMAYLLPFAYPALSKAEQQNIDLHDLTEHYRYQIGLFDKNDFSDLSNAFLHSHLCNTTLKAFNQTQAFTMIKTWISTGFSDHDYAVFSRPLNQTMNDAIESCLIHVVDQSYKKTQMTDHILFMLILFACITAATILILSIRQLMRYMQHPEPILNGRGDLEVHVESQPLHTERDSEVLIDSTAEDQELCGILAEKIHEHLSSMKKTPDILDIQKRWICPITLEIMCLPVKASDNHHYEWHAIKSILASEHPKSPMTREVLSKTVSLDPAMSQAILKFLESYQCAKSRHSKHSHQGFSLFKKTYLDDDNRESFHDTHSDLAFSL